MGRHRVGWRGRAIASSMLIFMGCEDVVEGSGASHDGGETETESSGTTGDSLSAGSGSPTSATSTSTTTAATDTGTTAAESSTGSEDSTGGCPAGTKGCVCDGGQCDEMLFCDNDVCVDAVMCMDPGPEPNEDEAGAIALGSLSCDDDTAMTAGILDGASDVDWFRFHGDEEILCDPLAVVAITTAGNPRLCVYADCDSGTTDVDCDGGSNPDTSPDGHPGCCAMGNVAFTGFNCQGTLDESTEIYMRVDQGDPNMCVSYDLTYGV